jgi:hypothetical protein
VKSNIQNFWLACFDWVQMTDIKTWTCRFFSSLPLNDQGDHYTLFHASLSIDDDCKMLAGSAYNRGEFADIRERSAVRGSFDRHSALSRETNHAALSWTSQIKEHQHVH